MKLMYSLGVALYGLGIRLASLWQPKARLWLQGRKNWRQLLSDVPADRPVCWFHTASLGEFEQGRPLLEAYRELHPTHYILLSFFSPSGYEARKNYAGADKVVYLPLDSRQNARDFLKLVHPQLVIFIKYEYWYHYFMEIGRLKLPFYLVSAVFRPNQPFFKPWVGSFWQKLLQQPTHIFVQDQASAALLKKIHVNRVTVNSDTRFDRVAAVRQLEFTDNQLEAFCNGKTIIAGSSWPKDEALLQQAFKSKPLAEWKLILVPHDLHEHQLKQLQSALGSACVRYSKNPSREQLQQAKYLIIDTIGLLSKIYRYGQIVYIGGGFGQGIHNTLEAAVYGLAVVFGPKHEKFLEAAELLKIGAAYEVNNAESLQKILSQLASDADLRQNISARLVSYFKEKCGATARVMQHIDSSSQ